MGYRSQKVAQTDVHNKSNQDKLCAAKLASLHTHDSHFIRQSGIGCAVPHFVKLRWPQPNHDAFGTVNVGDHDSVHHFKNNDHKVNFAHHEHSAHIHVPTGETIQATKWVGLADMQVPYTAKFTSKSTKQDAIQIGMWIGTSIPEVRVTTTNMTSLQQAR